MCQYKRFIDKIQTFLVLFCTCMLIIWIITAVSREKVPLMAWVVLLVWNRLFRIDPSDTIDYILEKSVSYQKIMGVAILLFSFRDLFLRDATHISPPPPILVYSSELFVVRLLLQEGQTKSSLIQLCSRRCTIGRLVSYQAVFEKSREIAKQNEI